MRITGLLNSISFGKNPKPIIKAIGSATEKDIGLKYLGDFRPKVLSDFDLTLEDITRNKSGSGKIDIKELDKDRRKIEEEKAMTGIYRDFFG